MTWNATPWIEYDGRRVQTAGIDTDWTTLVVPDLSVVWGRPNLLEHAETGSATFTLAARVSASEVLRNPQGREVVIGYTAEQYGWYPFERVIFRGRVDSVEFDTVRTKTGEDVFLTTITAPGRLAEVARIKIKDRTPRRYELFIRRKEWFETKLGATTAGYIGAGTAFPYSVAEVDYHDTDLLTAIRQLYTTSGEAVTYDPGRDIVDGMGWWQEARTTPVLFLVWRDGKVAVAPFKDGHGTFDAGQINMSSAEVKQEQTISSRVIEGFRYHRDEDPQWEYDYTLTSNIAGVEPGMEFRASGISYINLRTMNDNGPVASLGLWKTIVESARLFQPPPITQQHRHGWASDDDLNRALGGREWRETGYIMGSVYSPISENPPFCRPIGGTIRYATGKDNTGHWETTHTLAAAQMNRALNPITLGDLNPGSELRTNLAPDPRAVNPMGHYGAPDQQVITTTTVQGPPPGITTANRVTYDGTKSNPGVRLFIHEQNTTYTISCWVYHHSAPAGASAGFAQSGVTAGPSEAVATGAWKRVSWTYTTGSSPNRIGYRISGRPAGPGAFSITGVLVEKTTTVGTYFDGDTPQDTTAGVEYAWEGDPNDSVSVQREIGNEAFTYDDFHDSLTLLDLANVEEGL